MKKICMILVAVLRLAAGTAALWRRGGEVAGGAAGAAGGSTARPGTT